MTTVALHASERRIEITCPDWCARVIGAVYAPATRPLLPVERVARWEAVRDERGWQLFDDGVLCESGVGGDVELAAAIETRFLFQLASWHPNACVLHAGLVELDGVWVLFAGDSGRGKSSMTLELTRRGGRYFSDELVITDAERIWAVPRCPVFDFGPADAPLPAWLQGLDRESYRFERRPGEWWARPLHRVPDIQWAAAPVSVKDVAIVRLEGRESDAVRVMSAGEALATLLDASLTRDFRQLGPLASSRRAFGLQWTQPRVAVDALAVATRHLVK